MVRAGLEAAPHAARADFGQARRLHRGAAAAGLSRLDQILRRLRRAQPRSALQVFQAVSHASHAGGPHHSNITQAVSDLRQNLPQLVQERHAISACTKASDEASCLDCPRPRVGWATLHPLLLCQQPRLHRLICKEFGHNLQLLLQETHTVVDCSVDDTVAVDPNGCCEVLHSNGANFGIAVCSLGKELLVKAVAVLCGQQVHVTHHVDDIQALCQGSRWKTSINEVQSVTMRSLFSHPNVGFSILWC
mmetsp:Transcript_5947/g.10199  ORF Transcript_5947/g.10199 Transcript_5947/m.10199 type:complete len:248 (-) Transcript_5947:143-886(-)